MTDEEYNEKLAAVRRSVEKQFGKNTVMKLGDNPNTNIEGFHTGSFALDRAIGGNGFPVGRVIELFGMPSSGKTSLALRTIATVQKAGGHVLFIDAEHALDCAWAEKLGVNVPELELNQPSYGEEGLTVAFEYIAGGCAQLVVVDSIAAMAPKAQMDGEFTDSHVGLQARMMSKAMPKFLKMCVDNKATLLLLNQMRTNIGNKYEPMTTPGGVAVKFSSSVRMKLTSSVIKKGDEKIGTKVNCWIVKNKVAPPFTNASFEIHANGIRHDLDILDTATDAKIIQRTGGWYKYNGENIGQGRDNAADYIMSNPEVLSDITAKLKAPREES